MNKSIIVLPPNSVATLLSKGTSLDQKCLVKSIDETGIYSFSADSNYCTPCHFQHAMKYYVML